ncbi:MAG: ph-response sensor protein [Bathelium mastoideum]|nr:MAG: ph-response sensor protein [Bathelium mastoideum]
MDFPGKGLPSSIDFERGTISYTLTASLTRPTTISPVANCDRKLKFLETIDIAPLSMPKPREVSLKAVSKRSRVRQMSRRHTADQSPHVDGSPSDVASNRRASGSQDGNQGPRSPCPSELSFDSFASSAGRNSHYDSGVRSTKTSDSGRAMTNTSSNVTRTITATIEILRPGGLPGDSIPLRITVNHVKSVKSLHGVIVTLYRQAHVDMHPALPLAPMKKGEKERYEDYYPKSLTGLGGLSLSAAGSRQMFRKDLSQSFAPLIIDPTTLAADVKATVQVPEGAFPTITCVPGAMISFKYYVEVVLDLQGKLAGQDRFLPNIGLLNQPMAFNSATGSGQVNSSSMIAAWDENIIDTEPLRRDKSVVSCMFEVVVGTKDSKRKRGKHLAEAIHEAQLPEQAFYQGNDYGFEPPGNFQEPYSGEQWATDYHEDGYGYDNDQNFAWSSYGDHQDYGGHGYQHEHQDTNLQDLEASRMAEHEMQLPEKERLRRAEERLLPSQPPEDVDPGPFGGSASRDAPSAPPLTDGLLHWNHEHTTGPANSRSHAQFITNAGDPTSDALATDVPSVREVVPRYSPFPRSGPSRNEQLPSQSLDLDNSRALATDDKQELERRRLQIDASSPDGVDPESHGSQAADTATVHRMPFDDRPTAPVLEDHNEERAGPSEGLPRYEG